MKVEIKGVSKEYDGHKALDHVSFEIPSGSIFGLLGPNGAGKTSLIRIITQITAADTGTILMDGEPLKSSFISRVGYLPEERGLYKKMKVKEQLMYISRLKSDGSDGLEEKVDAWLEKFDLTDWANKNVEELSKGMQQKIQFIATVINEPELLILDEPFSGFDPVNANLLKEEIMRLNKEGVTIIFSTHRMESVEEICTHIGLINNSQIILNGELDRIQDKFKTNTYLIKGVGNLKLPSGFKVEALKDGFKVSLGEGMHSKDLFRELIKVNFEITHFSELIPSVNEIFLKLVEKKKSVVAEV